MANDVCPWRHAYLFDNPLRRIFHNPERLLEPYVMPGSTVLDVGCGMGFFSIGMARLVGLDGLVLSVDRQQEMLDVTMRRATRKGVSDRIRTQRCTADNLCVTADVDFILAFWMVHEVPDQDRMLRQMRAICVSDGRLLIVEPKIHVTETDFRNTTELAVKAGWRHADRIAVRLSRAAVFEAGT